jgi:hypothetical protein
VDILLIREEDMMGYLRVKAISLADAPPGSSEEMLQTAAEELQEADVRLVSDWEEDNDPSLNRVEDLSGLFITKGILKDTPVELRFGLARRGGLQFAFTLIAVRRDDDRLLWMRSKRAYEIAMATARPA